MSMWLRSVNNLLEKLDGQVGEVVEADDDEDYEEEEEEALIRASSVDAILSKRGLSNVDEEEVLEEGGEEEEIVLVTQEKEEEIEFGTDSAKEEEEEEETIEFEDELGKEEDKEVEEVEVEEMKDEELGWGDEEEPDIEEVQPTEKVHPTEKEQPTEPQPTPEPQPIITPPPSSTTSSQPSTHPNPELKPLLKEIRILRRNLITLNAELETAETEISLQKKELTRAAARIEKDHLRQKEEREEMRRQHGEELREMEEERDREVRELKEAHRARIEEVTDRLRQAEEARAKEGGDWKGELAGALQREQDLIRQNLLLKDEKSTLSTRITSLGTQLEGLQGRVQSLGNTANQAMDREKEAEDRLEGALSLHARQIGQRQAREAELERTVADLTTALVQARRNATTNDKPTPNDETTHKQQMEQEAKLASLQEEIESLHSQLSLESHHSNTLQQQLQDISKERTEETSKNIIKQRQYDRQISQLNSTLQQYRSQILELEKNPPKKIDNAAQDQILQYQKQTSVLSEQILKQQSKIESTSSKITTLEHQLQFATHRAELAEQELLRRKNNGEEEDLERGVRKPSKKSPTSQKSSIRAAMRLNHGRSWIGAFVDILDSWSVEAGRFLRYNALARGAFVSYLIIIHLYTFCLLVFHAHSLDGDFGFEGHPAAVVEKNPVLEKMVQEQP